MFNSYAVSRNRSRAFGGAGSASFLIDYALNMMLERVKGNFAQVIDLGCHAGNCARILHQYILYERLIQCDFGAKILMPLDGHRVVIDDRILPFQDASADLVISAVTMHSINDLGGMVRQIFRVLKPGGIFVGSLFGHQTLKELKEAIIAAESFESAQKRVFPFISVKDAGRLIQGCGFKFAVADADILTVQYQDIWCLFQDLKAMGESNALSARNPGLTTKNMLERITSFYPGKEASFEIVVVTGMKPTAVAE